MSAGTLPPRKDPQVKRLFELHRDGYIFDQNGHWILSDLGWRCLLANAIPRIRRPGKVTREMIREGRA
jgi:hypothetical protein